MFDRIKELCKEKGITISRLEILCGLANGTIRKWDHSSPRMDNLMAAAKVLGVSAGYLMEGGKRR